MTNAETQAIINLNYRGGAAITPSDTGDHDFNALVAGVAGNVKVDFIDGTTAIVALAAGIPVPYKVTRVYTTSTTATGIVGLNPR